MLKSAFWPGRTVRLTVQLSNVAQLPDCGLGQAGCFLQEASYHLEKVLPGKAVEDTRTAKGRTTRWAKLTVRQLS
jgi:hypothetical protein